MSELKTFEDLYYFLKEDFGNFALFGHNFNVYENSKNSTWFYVYKQYQCIKCFLIIESYRHEIVMFENDHSTGIDIDKSLLLKDRFPTCEKRCNEQMIKKIIV